MPRKFVDQNPANLVSDRPLVTMLFNELRHPKDYGQPWIAEVQRPGCKKAVTVVWDRFSGCSDGERQAIVAAAYGQYFGSAAGGWLLHRIGTTPIFRKYDYSSGMVPPAS